jgi:hypothetical protein
MRCWVTAAVSTTNGMPRWPSRPGGGAAPDQLGPVGPAPAPGVTLRGRGRWRVDVPYPPIGTPSANRRAAGVGVADRGVLCAGPSAPPRRRGDLHAGRARESLSPADLSVPPAARAPAGDAPTHLAREVPSSRPPDRPSVAFVQLCLPSWQHPGSAGRIDGSLRSAWPTCAAPNRNRGVSCTGDLRGKLCPSALSASHSLTGPAVGAVREIRFRVQIRPG